MTLRSYEIFPDDDPRVAAGNPYDLKNYDLALAVDTPGACALTACIIEFEDDRIEHLSQGVVPDRYAIYIAAIYGNQLYPEPLRVARHGVVRAFTFGAKVADWLAENNEIRATYLQNQIKALGTDIARLIQDTAKIRSSPDNTLH